MKISIRKFTADDIPDKVRWINDPNNNRYLHYDLPLEIEKTQKWFDAIKSRTDRYDAVITADEIPVGLIGLLSIDQTNNKAEYYISMGEVSYKGKGVAYNASVKLLEYAFYSLRLDEVYLFTETENIPAQKLFEKIGFIRQELLASDLNINGRNIDRFSYSLTKYEFVSKHTESPVIYLDDFNDNRIFIKRDDLIPFSFGGNKARKAKLFFEEIDNGGFDCVVTYGSSHSNHCRIVANMAAKRKIPCYIISPEESSENTNNKRLMDLFGAVITVVPVKDVHDTIESKISECKTKGLNPYFIPGGGHGNIGTYSYVICYDEIKAFENERNIKFDYIFLASGTGTTQAGLVCGQILNCDKCSIIGISIARKKPRGRDVILKSISDFFADSEFKVDNYEIENRTIFLDSYIADGYGTENSAISDTIKELMINYGLPTDSTYTGKAFYGMKDFILENNVSDKNILFIHTGGTPLFFDDLQKF